MKEASGPVRIPWRDRRATLSRRPDTIAWYESIDVD